MQKVTIKEFRDNLADIMEKVSGGGESFLVTKFGKIKALITPVVEKKGTKYINWDSAVLRDSAGIWKDRKDMTDSAKWVAKLRKKQSNKYGKIFS